jgi:hypothetical protein
VTARKHRDASVEAHVRIRYPSKKRLDEFVHALTGLARQSGESLLQRGVDSDRGVRHTRIIVPRLGHSSDQRASAGKGFPAPPKCLHKLGRLGRTRVERSGIDEDVESASHQQFDQKRARSRQF